MLNWNPSGPETFTINGFYSGGTISTVNAYNTGLANGRSAGWSDGYATGARNTGGLTIDGWEKGSWAPGVTECHVYPGYYRASFIYKTFAKYVSGYRLYLNGALWQHWQADPDEANNGAHGDIQYYVPYEATLRCEAYSSTNSGMLYIYGAIYRE